MQCIGTRIDGREPNYTNYLNNSRICAGITVAFIEIIYRPARVACHATQRITDSRQFPGLSAGGIKVKFPHMYDQILNPFVNVPLLIYFNYCDGKIVPL